MTCRCSELELYESDWRLLSHAKEMWNTVELPEISELMENGIVNSLSIFEIE